MDAALDEITMPTEIVAAIAAIPDVVEHGLFLNGIDTIVIARGDTMEVRYRKWIGGASWVSMHIQQSSCPRTTKSGISRWWGLGAWQIGTLRLRLAMDAWAIADKDNEMIGSYPSCMAAKQAVADHLLAQRAAIAAAST